MVIIFFSTAYALHIGSILPKQEMEVLFDKIDGILQQVYEVDSKFYRFEGGLTITGTFIIIFYMNTVLIVLI